MIRNKNRKRKTPKYFYVAALGVFLFLGVGYSVISTSLSFKGNVTAVANKWDIYFDNVSESGQNIVTITDGTQLSYNVTLNNPGDKIDFTVDVVNNGTLDALIKTMDITSLTSDQQKYINYAVEYEDGLPIELNDLLKKKSSRKIHVLVEYKKLKATDMYPDENINLTMNINLNYYQPKEEKYNVSLNVGSAMELKTVSNIEQETEVEEPIYTTDERYAVIVCPDRAYATTTADGKVIIKNVKEDTYCLAVNTINEAITDGFLNNSSANRLNITLLRNIEDTSDQTATVPSGKEVNIDLNGTTYLATFQLPAESEGEPVIVNQGVLTIKDSKENGTLKTNYRLISNYGTLNINSGKYIRENSTDTFEGGGVIGGYSGVTNLKNSTFKSDYTWCIFALGPTTINIDNCEAETTGQTTTLSACASDEGTAIFNIRNSTIKNSRDRAISFFDSIKTQYYVCNSRLISPTIDLFANNSNNMFFYSSDTIFRDGTNTPSYKTSQDLPIYKTDIACGE